MFFAHWFAMPVRSFNSGYLLVGFYSCFVFALAMLILRLTLLPRISVFYAHWFAMPTRENYDGAYFLGVFGVVWASLVVAGAGKCKRTSEEIEKTSHFAHS